MLLSCTYCCYNPMQLDALGTPYGYCVRREAILKQPTLTTCGWHRRRDLLASDADAVQQAHIQVFPGNGVYRLPDRANGSAGAALLDQDLDRLGENQVASTVRNWNVDQKVATLKVLDSQVHFLRSAKAEAALISLGRAYIANCSRRGGPWTSGLHLVAWQRKRLASIPQVRLDDLWSIAPTSVSRQTELAAWSLMMARILLIADIAQQSGSELAPLADVADEAALASKHLSPTALSTWVRKALVSNLDRWLPEARYRDLAVKLHRDESDDVAVASL